MVAGLSSRAGEMDQLTSSGTGITTRWHIHPLPHLSLLCSLSASEYLAHPEIQWCCYMTPWKEPSGVLRAISWASTLVFSLTVKYDALSATLFIRGHLFWDSHYETLDGPLGRYVPQLNLQAFLSKTTTTMVPSWWIAGWLTAPHYLEPTHQNSVRIRWNISLLADSAIHCSIQPGQACVHV